MKHEKRKSDLTINSPPHKAEPLSRKKPTNSSLFSDIVGCGGKGKGWPTHQPIGMQVVHEILILVFGGRLSALFQQNNRKDKYLVTCVTSFLGRSAAMMTGRYSRLVSRANDVC
jgi:hypothetical protein